ncbi:Jacalin-related lectin 17 [Cardamine amara subsp. amara]|uniref:Jacalin-related lectin 17 n=1 Tax=Cardamine amara subsp. amara TaxID=228776 RepID=A0ABD1BVA3_CARAN
MSQDSNLLEMTQTLEAQGQKDSPSHYKWDDGSDQDDVAKIYVRCSDGGITYIRFDYIKGGQPKYIKYPLHGSTDLGLLQTFEINHKIGERLESIVGYYEPKSNVIQGLQFKTNMRISELIGYERYITLTTTKFSLAVEKKKIIGFHGASTLYLNSLGAHFTWIAPTRMEAKGGEGGKEWNDGDDHEDIKKIYVRGVCDGIQYIKFDYVKDGQLIHG